MTTISGRLYEQAVSGMRTVQEAVVFLEKEAKLRTFREKLEQFFKGEDLSRDSIERRVRGWHADCRLGRYHNNVYQLFMEMLNTLEHPKLDQTIEDAALFDSESLTLREYFYEKNVLYAKEKRIFTVIQKHVSAG